MVKDHRAIWFCNRDHLFDRLKRVFVVIDAVLSMDNVEFACTELLNKFFGISENRWNRRNDSKFCYQSSVFRRKQVSGGDVQLFRGVNLTQLCEGTCSHI